MRNREVIEREMHSAREDLEASLAELRHVVQEKVDVKARALVAVEKGKQAAEDLIVRGIAEAKTLADKGKAGARDLYAKGRETVEERPVLIGSIAAGVIAVGAFVYIAHKRDWI